MSFTIINYNNKYNKQIIALLEQTWDFSLHFEDLVDIDKVYQYYLKELLLNSSYKRIVLNDKNQVLGVLLAELEPTNNNSQMLSLKLKLFFDILSGNFGHRQKAFSFFKQYKKTCKKLYSEVDFEKETYLLAISRKAKHKGLGKKLLKEYIKECDKRNVKKIALQTGADCDYHFYGHFGFTRENELYTSMYESGKEDSNFFIYTYKIG